MPITNRRSFLKTFSATSAGVMTIPCVITTAFGCDTTDKAVWKYSKKHSFETNFLVGADKDGTWLYVSQTRHGFGNVLGSVLKDLGSDLQKTLNELKGVGVSVTSDEEGNIKASPSAKLAEKSDWHLGKASKHLPKGMSYPYDGKELHAIEHFVFSPKDVKNWKWVDAAKKGKCPEGAVVGWNNKERQVVARARIPDAKNRYTPGKLLLKKGVCDVFFVGYANKETEYERFEVLTLEKT